MTLLKLLKETTKNEQFKRVFFFEQPYVDLVYDVIRMETKGLDSFYKDYILSLVGVYGLNALITHKLVETCGVVNGRQLYTLLEKRKG